MILTLDGGTAMEEQERERRIGTITVEGREIPVCVWGRPLDETQKQAAILFAEAFMQCALSWLEENKDLLRGIEIHHDQLGA